GVIRTHAANSWGWLSPQAVLLPQLLNTAGYRTALVGKWHLGLDAASHPNARGFGEFHGFLGDMMDDYYHHRRHNINYMRHNERIIDPQGHATDLFTQWSIDFIKQQSTEHPFFLYLAYNAPHTPIQPPTDWLEKVKRREPGIDNRRAKLVALIEHMDHGIGQILAALRETGLDRDTLVVFTSDNGGQVSAGARNGALRDGKQSVYEGGLKVPTCLVWPGRIAAQGTTSLRAMSMDLFPTVLEAAGLKPSQPIDGVSVLPVALGRQQAELRKYWFFRRREGGTRYAGKTIEAVRRGDWKLLQNSPFEPMELYNLASDPLEQQNVINQHRKVFSELAAALRAEIQRYGAVPWQRPDSP
ncbi:MAG: sulfatase-like hydrolase/transferase, partial [Planctomycetaceae bacterium]